MPRTGREASSSAWEAPCPPLACRVSGCKRASQQQASSSCANAQEHMNALAVGMWGKGFCTWLYGELQRKGWRCPKLGGPHRNTHKQYRRHGSSTSHMLEKWIAWLTFKTSSMLGCNASHEAGPWQNCQWKSWLPLLGHFGQHRLAAALLRQDFFSTPLKGVRRRVSSVVAPTLWHPPPSAPGGLPHYWDFRRG